MEKIENNNNNDFETAYRYIDLLINKYQYKHSWMTSFYYWVTGAFFGALITSISQGIDLSTVWSILLLIILIMIGMFLIFFMLKVLSNSIIKSQKILNELFDLQKNLIFKKITPEKAIEKADKITNGGR